MDTGLNHKLWKFIRGKFVKDFSIVLPRWLQIVWVVLHPKLALAAYANSTVGYNACNDTWKLGGKIELGTDTLMDISRNLEAGHTVCITKVGYNTFVETKINTK